MASTFTTSLRLDKQAIGDNKSTWGTVANRNFDLIEAGLVGYVDVPIANVNTDLPGTNGNTDVPRNFMLNFTGILTADRTVTVPNVTKTYIIRNSTTGTPAAFNIIFKTLGGSGVAQQVTLGGGEQRFVFFDTAKNAWTNENWVDISSATRRFDITARVATGGGMEVGKYIDFHNTNADATDFAMRLVSANASNTDSTTGLYIVNGASPSQSTAGLIWHSSNDGPGTGLNADLLDNLHAADLTFPAGTRMLFMQATAPTGWTRDTDATLNNRALRVVTTSVAGTGGTLDFTAAFASRGVAGTVGNTVLTEAQLPAHDHPITLASSGTAAAETTDHTHGAGTYTAVAVNSGVQMSIYSSEFPGYSYFSGTGPGDGSWRYLTNHTHDITGTSSGRSASHAHTVSVSGTGNTNNAGSGASHTHPFTGTNLDMSVKYIDAIIGIKA